MNTKYFVNDEQIDAQHTSGRWTAMFTHPQPSGVSGCPMGRGESREAAIKDLMDRTNRESSVEFVANSLKQKADKRAIDLGCSDKAINNIDPTYRGNVEINGTVLTVINSSSFSGVLHFGVCGPLDVANGSIVGWVPACLCNIN